MPFLFFGIIYKYVMQICSEPIRTETEDKHAHDECGYDASSCAEGAFYMGAC